MKRCAVTLLVLLTLAAFVGYSMYLGFKPQEELTPFEAFMYDPGMGILAGTLLVLGVGTAIGVSVLRRRRERAAWAAFAGEHGFEWANGGGEESISGSFQDRTIRLTTHLTRASSSRFGQHETGGSTRFQTLTVELGGTPEGLSIRPCDEAFFRFAEQLADALVGKLSPASRDVTTGDEAFDRATRVRATDLAATEAWLTPVRRALVLQLLEHPGCRLEPGALVHSRADRSQEESELHELLHRLAALAQKLEAS